MLRHSSLPTVLVEGISDARGYRHLEKQLDVGRVSILPCGGRINLLKVFERRREIPSLPLAFIADRDMWLFRMPAGYEEIIWTTGYSLENDVLAAGAAEDLLEPGEMIRFRQSLDVLIPWFAFEVEEFLAGRTAHVDVHPDSVLPPDAMVIREAHYAGRGSGRGSDAMIKFIHDDYALRLRGKNLAYLLARFLNSPRRHAQYNPPTLLDAVVRLRPNLPHWQQILAAVKARLKAH